MATRKSTPTDIELEVLTKSRRRCCICFGLNRDENIQKGQIAHLDRDASNYDFDNLAYMCLLHHDEYDTKTSQSKGWSIKEAKTYRKELYERFDLWLDKKSHDHLLNFLAYKISLDDMLDTGLNVAGQITAWNESVVIEVLSRDYIQYSDGDLWMPIEFTLNYFQSWGWLEFKLEEKKGVDTLMCFTIKHKPICKQLSELLSERIYKREKNKKP